ncbi:hypothetical protein Bbelb_276930 [Branchiostoma belcheri]|nr:hypothetical protein Bbelb_276930 [Branchiostoma belcheri]
MLGQAVSSPVRATPGLRQFCLQTSRSATLLRLLSSFVLSDWSDSGAVQHAEIKFLIGKTGGTQGGSPRLTGPDGESPPNVTVTDSPMYQPTQHSIDGILGTGPVTAAVPSVFTGKADQPTPPMCILTVS